MANDIDMWNDIEYFEKHKDKKRASLLLEAYNARYNEYDEELAEKLKKQYIKKFGRWQNYY
jgi:hypothetical protein